MVLTLQEGGAFKARPEQKLHFKSPPFLMSIPEALFVGLICIYITLNEYNS